MIRTGVNAHTRIERSAASGRKIVFNHDSGRHGRIRHADTEKLVLGGVEAERCENGVGERGVTRDVGRLRHIEAAAKFGNRVAHRQRIGIIEGDGRGHVGKDTQLALHVSEKADANKEIEVEHLRGCADGCSEMGNLVVRGRVRGSDVAEDLTRHDGAFALQADIRRKQFVLHHAVVRFRAPELGHGV